MSRPPASAAPAIVAALALRAAPALASGPLEILGAPTSSNGASARALARGPEAAFFNPALLPDAEPTAHAGFFLLFVHGDVLLQGRPAGVDVPESVYDAQLGNPDGSTSRLDVRPLPTSKLPSARAATEDRRALAYATLGVVRPLFDDRLVLGLYALLPVQSFQTQKAFFADEREQYFSNRLHFELLGDRMTLTTIGVALGSRLTRWLSAGAGVDVTIGTVARTAAHLPDAGDQREILLNPDIEVVTTFAPYFAVATRPARWLRLTTTLHLPSSSETDGENRIRFWNYTYPEGEDSIRQTYRLALGYEPLRIGVGAAVSGPPAEGARRARGAAPPAWEIGAQAVIQRWSEYVDRHAERPLDPWSPTVSVALGAAAFVGTRRVAADLTFAPSPVPEQTGRTNYVDNPRLGGGVSFETPVTLFGAEFGASAFVHGQVLLSREHEKRSDARNPVIDELPDNAVDLESGEPLPGAAGLQTNNPGYPGFSSEGWMLGAGVAIAL